MKALNALVLAIAALASTVALAGPADDKWIKQCQADNRNEGAKPDVVTKYCTCMNDKMDSNETRSITQWEKANPDAQKACSAQAGWK